MKILFFGNLGVLQGEGKPGPSSIVRVTNIVKMLTKHGYDCSIEYLNVRNYKRNYNSILNADVVVFHRIQASRTWIEPSFIPLFLLAKKCNKKVIFDYDDAIFFTFPVICEFCIKFADIVFAGSHALLSHAKFLNDRSFLIPSAVDTNLFSPPKIQVQKDNQGVIIGWHGSALGHFRNLKLLKPMLVKLSKEHSITLKILGSEGSQLVQDYFKIPHLNLVLGPKKWVPYDQLPLYLHDVDVGVSPLVDNSWNRSKCAMKAIEYMSLGKPVIASNVGEHRYVITNNVNGFLADNEDEWIWYLTELIQSYQLREKIGRAARKTAVEVFSLDEVSNKICNLLEHL
jgi:glycosyltransferase involved in cell wall biosynthesis